MSQPLFCLFETALGWCGIAWRGIGAPGETPLIAGFQLPEDTREATASRLERRTGGRRGESPPAEIADLIARVKRHLAGDLQDFSHVPVDLSSVEEFARRVYQATAQIPAGETRTYGDIARLLGLPDAARAVGQALGRNPVALLVPCHRVVAAGGGPGGFSAHGGLATKARLLEIEQGPQEVQGSFAFPPSAT